MKLDKTEIMFVIVAIVASVFGLLFSLILFPF